MTEPATELEPAQGLMPAQLADLAELVEEAHDLQERAWAVNTLTAYRKRWAAFQAWCAGKGAESLPALQGTLVAYVAHLSRQGLTTSTVEGHLAAVRWGHMDAGVAFERGPRLERVVQGHARKKGRRAQRRAKAMRVDDLYRISHAMGWEWPADLRDRAMLCFLLAGGMRRSELVALRVEDVEEQEQGLVVTVERAKADQEGRGSLLRMPYGKRKETCPVTAYQTWMKAAGIAEGRVFRRVLKNGRVYGSGLSDQSVALVIKARAEAAGLPPGFSGHSGRRGFATEAAAHGVPRQQIMKDGRWASNAVDVYMEEGQKWDDRAAMHLGL